MDTGGQEPVSRRSDESEVRPSPQRQEGPVCWWRCQMAGPFTVDAESERVSRRVGLGEKEETERDNQRKGQEETED